MDGHAVPRLNHTALHLLYPLTENVCHKGLVGSLYEVVSVVHPTSTPPPNNAKKRGLLFLAVYN